MGDFVRLTKEEAREAAFVGVERQLDAIYSGRFDHERTGRDDAWGNHIEGACAERAFCKAMNLPWVGKVNTFHGEADVGQDFEVRSTKYTNGHLIVRPPDPDDRLYVLMTGQVPLFVPRGWVAGDEAKHESYWQREKGAWYVPQFILRKINSLQGRTK